MSAPLEPKPTGRPLVDDYQAHKDAGLPVVDRLAKAALAIDWQDEQDLLKTISDETARHSVDVRVLELVMAAWAFRKWWER